MGKINQKQQKQKKRPNSDINKVKKPQAKTKKKNNKKSATSTISIKSSSFQIVPWSSSEEWDQVCKDFHEKNYKQVVSEILVWKMRVPVLPVGVESTLFILEALCYDELKSSPGSNYSEDQARSMYCLALVRYLNHVGHFAAFSLGEKSTMPTKDLASHVGTPDWLVSLRNEVSHGITTPSIEILRVAGDFILEWLKEKYWKHPEHTIEEPNSFDIFATTNESNETQANIMSQVLSAFIAARIYKFRDVLTINDPDITKYLRDKPQKAKTKTVIVTLRSTLNDFVNNNPSLMCSVISQEMVPSFDFYVDFRASFTDSKVDPFNQLFLVWTPIVKLLERKGKLLSVCLHLAEIHVTSEINQEVSARWISNFLEVLQQSGKVYPHKLQSLLRVVMTAPNSFTKLFLPRLITMLEEYLGESKVRKLQNLISIWTDDSSSVVESTKASKNKKVVTLNSKEGEDYFTINHILNKEMDQSQNNFKQPEENWELDSRGSNFWRNVPFGAVLNQS